MKNKKITLITFAFIFILACNLPGVAGSQEPVVANQPAVTGNDAATSTVSPELPTPTSTTAITHVKTPSASAKIGKLIFDVDSSVTAAEKRAPYGDSYDINRLERPFTKDMTYLPDLDIVTFGLSEDADWYYISMGLIGTNPNDQIGINYAVELDTNADGFGDYIVLAVPTYSRNWSTQNVKVFADTNHDTSGLSADKADVPAPTNGYDKLVFDGNGGAGDDPDLAWVRVNANADAIVQFAFKKSLAGTYFMYGVLADAGLKDVSKLDYVDRFPESLAGSPVKDKKYYPLNQLFAVDNTCRDFYGFKPNGYEPMLCPNTQPNPTGKPTSVAPTPVPGKP